MHSCLRRDFPALAQKVHGRPLVYLDNAATTQVPLPVLEAFCSHYMRNNANVHRGIHTLSERSTSAFEQARETVRTFIGAADKREVVFTSGTTAAINMVARMMGQRLGEGDTVVVTAMEHHANFVPWQQVCKRTGAQFVVAPLTPEGEVDLDALQAILGSHKVALFAFTHVSNVLGTVNPVETMVKMAHERGALALVDAAQSIRHERVNVSEMDCDFLCFSGHKVLSTGGIGVLYGKASVLEGFEPVDFGGEMVDKVTSHDTTFESLPLRFEAGTPNYPGAIALAAALDYLEDLGRDEVARCEYELLGDIEARLKGLPSVAILGNPRQRAGCVSFSVEGTHPFDVAMLLDKCGVAVRSGNQCAQPLLHEVYGLKNIVRVSPAFYNTVEDIDLFFGALEKVLGVLHV